MDRGRLDGYRAKVADELAAIRDLADAADDDTLPVQLDQQSVGRLSRMDALQRQAMASETKRRRDQRRSRLQQALRRIEEDEFGYCAECGEEIPVGRLDVDPTFHLCVRCSDQKT